MHGRKLKILDLFCGTGALSYGIHSRSKEFITVGGIDLNPSAARTAALNHPDAKILCQSIESIAPEELVNRIGTSSIDVIVGGPPCQGFSSLRPSRGAGLEDPRNALYTHFLRYVGSLRPRAFLMENVVGILSAGQGNLVDEIREGFRRLGYLTDWRVINAANYGVPQKRERFFLMGLRESMGGHAKLSFPAPSHHFSGRVIGTRHKDRYITNRKTGLPALTVRDAISDLPSLGSGESSSVYATPPRTPFQAARRHPGTTLTMHEAANHNAKMLEVIRLAGTSISALPRGLVSSGYSSCYSRLAFDEPATTITVKFTSPASSRCIHPSDDRAITPREAARLQSFDDSFEFAGSKTDIASQIGNAVPPLFGHAFALALEEMLDAQGIGEH